MIYRGPGFLAVVSLVSMLDRRHRGRLRKRDNVLPGEGGRSGRGAASYDRKKALPSYNHTILSVPHISKSLFLLQEQSPLSLLERNYGIPRLDQLEAMDRLRETRIDGAGHATGVLFFCSV
jgi:hypothetical protein